MFKCEICGKEFEDKELTVMKLLNKQTKSIEEFHVCSVCGANKEELTGYATGKKDIDMVASQQVIDYFTPYAEEIKSELLKRYIDVRIRATESKLEERRLKGDVPGYGRDRKKDKRVTSLKITAIVSAALFSLALFILFCAPEKVAIGVIGAIVAVALFIVNYFLIDTYTAVTADKMDKLDEIRERLGAETAEDDADKNKTATDNDKSE